MAVATAVKVKPATEAIKTKPRVELPNTLKIGDFLIAEFAAARYNIWLPVGWKFEDVFRPEFWAGVSHRLAKQPVTNEPDKSGAIIEIRTKDHNFYAEVYVTIVQEKGLIVKTLREPVYFDLKEIPENDVNRAQWNPAKHGWDIVRKSDGAVLADGTSIRTRAQAQEWMEKTLRN